MNHKMKDISIDPAIELLAKNTTPLVCENATINF